MLALNAPRPDGEVEVFNELRKFSCALLALNGTQLCFADEQNILYMFDTRDALAQAKGRGRKPEAELEMSVAGPLGRDALIMRPVLTNGQVYVAVWDFGRGTNIVYLAQCNADDGSNPQLKNIGDRAASTGTAADPRMRRFSAEFAQRTRANRRHYIYVSLDTNVYGRSISKPMRSRSRNSF